MWSVFGSFFFLGDDVDKFVGVFSGGEWVCVLFAKFLFDLGNLLLFDELINYFDFESCESFIEIFDIYDGMMVFVSYNCGFIWWLVNKIWSVEDGEVIEYLGNFDDYMCFW